MPSDPRTFQALTAVSSQREVFRAAVGAAAAEIGTWLNGRQKPVDGRWKPAPIELGAFASGRIDLDLFAATFATDAALDPLSLARLESARELMLRLLASEDDLFVARIAPGEDVRTRIAAALAHAGRAFAAARVAEMVRLRRYSSDEEEYHTSGYPTALWNRGERQMAPPLVVEVKGGDLQVGGLGELMVGCQKIVLLVSGPAPPAPLIRLATPGVFVLQATDLPELAQIGSTAGPAVAALLPEGSARFVHRPGAKGIQERLEVQYLPERPRGSVGTLSLFQQIEELEQLRMLATAGAPITVAAGADSPPAPSIPAAAPADRLAAWLLSQAGFNGQADGAG